MNERSHYVIENKGPSQKNEAKRSQNEAAFYPTEATFWPTEPHFDAPAVALPAATRAQT